MNPAARINGGRDGALGRAVDNSPGQANLGKWRCKPLTPKPCEIASGAATASLSRGISQFGLQPLAFSLVELLIVIAIIGILAALLLPVLNRAHEEGRATACVSNLHQIGLALQMYVDSNNNTLPAMEDAPMDTNTITTNALPTVNVVLGTDLANTNVLCCPSDFQKIFQLTGSSYSWNNLLNGENANHLIVFGMNFRPGAIPVFFDKQGFHAARGAKKAVNYLYADQHIKNLLTIEGSLPQ